MKYAERQIRNGEILAQSKSGLPAAEISKLFGISRNSVSWILQRRFKKTPPPGFHPKQKNLYLEIAKMREAGATLLEIAGKHQLTRERVRQICLFVSRKDWEVGRGKNIRLIEKMLGCPISQVASIRRRCARCGGTDKMNQRRGPAVLCYFCTQQRNSFRRLRHRILSGRFPSQAAWQIRSKKLTPKDFRSFFVVVKKA